MSAAESTSSRAIGRWLLLGAAAIALLSVGYAVMREKDEPAARASASTPASAPASDGTPDPEAIIRKLQQRVDADPKDADGWFQLGWVYLETGKYAEAVRAYRHATELEPGDATAWSSLGEALVMADGKNPMPDAAAKAFDKALALDPTDPRARYFSAVRKDLSGDHRGAIDGWLALLKDSPPGAPWAADLRHTIEQAGKVNGIEVADRLAAIPAPVAPAGTPPPSAAGATPGPDPEQMQAVANLPREQQEAMIASMVGGLEEKLKADPGNVEGWVMLMRSRMTLGEGAKASAALKAAISANPSKEGYLREQAARIRVPGA